MKKNLQLQYFLLKIFVPSLSKFLSLAKTLCLKKWTCRPRRWISEFPSAHRQWHSRVCHRCQAYSRRHSPAQKVRRPQVPADIPRNVRDVLPPPPSPSLRLAFPNPKIARSVTKSRIAFGIRALPTRIDVYGNPKQ